MEKHLGKPLRIGLNPAISLCLVASSFAATAVAEENNKANAAARAATQATVATLQNHALGYFSGIRPTFRIGRLDSATQSPRGAAAQFDPEMVEYSVTPTAVAVNNSIAPILSKGSVGLVILGAEHFDEIDTVMGLTLTIDTSAITVTEISSGGGTAVATVNGTGYTVAPYIAKQLESGMLLDASIGLGTSNSSIVRDTLSGKPQASRSFIAVGATKYINLSKKALLTTKMAFSLSHDKVGSFALSNGTTSAGSSTSLSQFKLSAQYRYQLEGITPFLEVGLITNSLTAKNSGGETPKEYAVTIPAAVGISFSKGNIYGIVKFQSERGKSQTQAYIGKRF
jgi:hypothetical protein